MTIQTAIEKAVAVYGNAVLALIEATSKIGVTFCSIKNYKSDKSDNTENAQHLINIGVRYETILEKDANIYEDFDVSTIDVNRFNYSSIDTAGLSLEAYKAAVKAALPIALAELQQPKKERQSNDVYLSKVIVFNVTTERLSILGQSVTKTVTEKGEFKKVKSAPKTIAKRLIEFAAKPKSNDIRRFAIDNLEAVKLFGDTIEI
jgi:hypothetical protein